MAATPTANNEAALPPEPVPPEDWECCGSECGDACIQTMYWVEKARYDAQQRKLKEAGWIDGEDGAKAV